MNKKGQAELLVYVIRIIFIAVLAFLLSVQLGFFTNMDTPTNNLEAQLIMQRILNSPAGLAMHEDLTNRVLTGTVNISRFNDASMTAIYDEGFDQNGGNFWGEK